MPSYASPDYLQEILARSWGVTGDTAASLHEEVLKNAIEEAEFEIDSRLRGRYTVPFDPVPGLIKVIATAIAAYSADLTFREVRDYSSELNPVLLRYDRAKMMLKSLASGESDLPPDVPESGDASGGGVVVFAQQYNTLFDAPGLFDLNPNGCMCTGFCSCFWGSPEFWGMR